MITRKNIDWYLSEPTRLLLKKPFTRGGKFQSCKTYIGDVTLNQKSTAQLSDLTLQEVSQDLYLREYDPSLHNIKYNNSIPKIAVRVGDTDIVIDELVLTVSLQKNIHAAHVLHLTANPISFTLCNIEKNDTISKKFQNFKLEWNMRNMEQIKYELISKQKKVGDAGVLFKFDPIKKKGTVKVYSYDDGYSVIPNYNEYGEEISRSLFYKIDDLTEVIDTFDDKYLYRSIRSKEGEPTNNGWVTERILHGFSRNPLVYHRGKVAWEYSQSIIEIIELLTNIHAVTLKRFGTWGLVLKGEMNEDSFKRDNGTLVINLPADEGSSYKTEAKTLEFPEPESMIAYLEYLLEQVSIASSVSFITPKDITNTGSGGNGIALSMRNDIALATQSVADWSDSINEITYLFQEMLGLEEDQTNAYTDLKIKAKLNIWSMETNNTKITNLAMESKWISRQTLIEESPSSAPDEIDRVEREQKKAKEDAIKQAEKAERISKNNNTEIIETPNKTTYSSNV